MKPSLIMAMEAEVFDQELRQFNAEQEKALQGDAISQIEATHEEQATELQAQAELIDDQAQAIGEVQSTAVALEEIADSLDEAVEDKEAVVNPDVLAAVAAAGAELQESLAAPASEIEAVNDAALKAAVGQTEAQTKDVADDVVVAVVESFRDTVSRATQAVLAALRRIIKLVKDFIKNIFSARARLDKRITEVRKQLTSAGDFNEGDVQLQSKKLALAINGTDIDYGLNKLEKIIAATASFQEVQAKSIGEAVAALSRGDEPAKLAEVADDVRIKVATAARNKFQALLKNQVAAASFPGDISAFIDKDVKFFGKTPVGILVHMTNDLEPALFRRLVPAVVGIIDHHDGVVADASIVAANRSNIQRYLNDLQAISRALNVQSERSNRVNTERQKAEGVIAKVVAGAKQVRDNAYSSFLNALVAPNGNELTVYSIRVANGVLDYIEASIKARTKAQAKQD